jgi:hypothetical protein
MEPIFQNHNRDQFEVFAYSNTLESDKHTERMKGHFDHWVDVTSMTDEEMAQRIYADQIDILVDMAGHTAGNRLPVFAMRPAPIQASYWIGFGYTTGLRKLITLFAMRIWFRLAASVISARSRCACRRLSCAYATSQRGHSGMYLSYLHCVMDMSRLAV